MSYQGYPQVTFTGCLNSTENVSGLMPSLI